MIQLRPYQLKFVADLRGAFRAGHRRVLGVMPTGSGKTAASAAMVAGAIANGHRVLFAAGRRELIDQTVAALAAAGVTDVRIIQAQRDEGRPDAPVIVGSVQTLCTDRWLTQLPRCQFGICDESQHSVASTWSDLIKSQPEARWVGLTATPCRSDGRPLGDLFDTLVTGPSVSDLTDLGHLVPCRIWAGPSTLKPGELAMAPLAAYRRFAPGQRASVYCRDVAHAESELELFRAAGVPSDVVTGSMPARRRAAALDAWRAGEILVVTSVGVLTEGFDLPALGTAILARRFGHVGQYLQVAGRILRTFPGKREALLVDLTGCAHEHGPVALDREYSLTGKAISGGARESFGHCPTCGFMFLYGPLTCASCGAEILVRPLAAPRDTGAGVAELAPARPRVPWVSALLARFEGTCRNCKQWFPRGTPVYSTSGERGSIRHQRCPVPATAAAP